MRIAIGIWIAILVFIAAKSYIKPNTHTVYTTYSQAAQTWFEYETPRRFGISYLQRQYCPFFGVLMQPFAALPDAIGGALWSSLGLGLIGTGLFRLLGQWKAMNLVSNQATAMMCLPIFGIASIFNGQANMLMLGSMLWATTLLLDKSYWRAGFFLALPIAIKTYPIALAMVFVGLVPRILLPTAISLAGMCLLPFLFCSRETAMQLYSQWLGFLVSQEHIETSFITSDFRAFLVRMGMSPSRPVHLLMQASTGAAVFAVALRIRKRLAVTDKVNAQNHALSWGYLLTSIWFVAFGPATEEATYLLAAPALAVLAERTISNHSTSIVHSLFAAVLLIVIGPTQASFFGETVRKWIFDQKLAPCALTIVFAYLVVQQAIGRPITAERSPLLEKSADAEPIVVKGMFGDDRNFEKRKAA